MFRASTSNEGGPAERVAELSRSGRTSGASVHIERASAAPRTHQALRAVPSTGTFGSAARSALAMVNVVRPLRNRYFRRDLLDG